VHGFDRAGLLTERKKNLTAKGAKERKDPTGGIAKSASAMYIPVNMCIF
jgi:hypothetical protein